MALLSSLTQLHRTMLFPFILGQIGRVLFVVFFTTTNTKDKAFFCPFISIINMRNSQSLLTIDLLTFCHIYTHNYIISSFHTYHLQFLLVHIIIYATQHNTHLNQLFVKYLILVNNYHIVIHSTNTWSVV